MTPAAHRRALSALVAGAVLLPLAACGDTGEPRADTGPTPAATSPAESASSSSTVPTSSATTPEAPPSSSSAVSSTPATTAPPKQTTEPSPTKSSTPKPDPSPTKTSTPFTATVSSVSDDDVRYTYRSGCPVGPKDLTKITMTYRNYDGEVKTGVLIVASKSAKTAIEIFHDSFDAGFRINRMTNPNEWKGDDKKMMVADNTSAFNCRRVTGDEGKLSPHSYGTAIDVNTRRNPYRAANKVWYPSNGSKWVDRSVDDAGMVRSSSTFTKGVREAGGIWGGVWGNPDYQHYELD